MNLSQMSTAKSVTWDLNRGVGCYIKMGLLAMMSVLLVAGCASAPNDKTGSGSKSTNLKAPNRYQVQQGDTVSKIALRYGLDWRALSRLNQLDANHTIYVGQWLVLKGVAKSTPTQAPSHPTGVMAPKPPVTTTAPALSTVVYEPTPTLQQDTPLVGSSGVMQFRYPVSKENKVARQFGVNVGGVASEGMFFSGKEGDVVSATQAGVVVLADKAAANNERSVVMVQHKDGYTSSYFDIKNIQVATGQNINAGDKIGIMQQKTSSGIAVFEFRMTKNGRYIDPVSVLR